ncbi:invertase [Philodulcilactobacillus myokoensis]|uniref:Sucrose-6-phosphate hydrolase n=1 Tax=Philodulcilactobacillus myokoensis TaxID=2929573 RepID=A0A9W6AYZ4_9LACO|nr:sucrose-6-phosphate hydrolase [Philodulcilactobacillus myokoensis]GLB46031.1 invertase [Philodulcilactobacillus myokoensis]
MDKQYWTAERLNLPYDQWSKASVDQLKTKVRDSKWRLGYHIQPESGLLNDPNGFSYYNHQWHLFYQSFPFGPVHGLKSWAHLVSPDLIHWQDVHQPMIPDSSNDRNGCYSGSALPINDQLFLMYTGNIWDNGVRKAKQNGAFVNQDNQITKLAHPLIDQPSEGITGNFRDPQIIKHANYYYAIIGAQTDNRRGEILVYRSKYLDHGWYYYRKLDIGTNDLGYMVECPNLVFIDGRPVIIFCPQGMSHKHLKYANKYPNTYIVGKDFNWDKMKFINPSKIQQLDNGFESYATQAINAPDGRVLEVSWIGMPDLEEPDAEDGWTNALSLVRELSLDGEQLTQKPAAENKGLSDHELKSINGMEVPKQCLLDFAPTENKGSQFAITSGESHLLIDVDDDNNRLTLHRLNKNGNEEQRIINMDTAKVSDCQIYLDNSLFEIYINGGEKLMSGRVFFSHSVINATWIDCQAVELTQLKKLN